MKKILLALLMSVGAISPVIAAYQPLALQKTTLSEGDACGLRVSDISLQRQGDLMLVTMNLDLASFTLKGDRAVILTPELTNGTDSADLDPVGLYSRIRYIQYIRDNESPIGGDGEITYRYSKRPETLAYTQSIPYQDWMNGAELKLKRRDYGCCNSLLDQCDSPLAAWREITYEPQFVFQEAAAATVKTRELAGRAFIDFPVNMTNLYPNYRNNPVELAKIIATIDSVRSDKDVTVKRITIKGWASPESPWENNTRLAKGRTATLKQYVMNLYNFPDDFIETDYYPEDWFGLRDFVESSNLPHRAEILALIDDDSIEPDPKEDKLKKTYPDEYKFLLTTVYPGLRHSDYKIEYTIRQFVDVAEIAEVMRTAPHKLSLNEIYLLAGSLTPGSPEYNEVYETAAKMFPTDETANLNAANVAMQRADFDSAAQYLGKAGDSPKAVYARGVLASKRGDHEQALKYFRQAAPQVPQAAEAVNILQEILSNK